MGLHAISEMGLDLHMTRNHGSCSLNVKTHYPETPLVEVDEDVDVFWSHFEEFYKDEQPSPSEQPPSISDFKIFISDSDECLQPVEPTISDDHSVYEFPNDDCRSCDSIYVQDVVITIPKKSVRFSDDTVFVERNMESPFWRELTNRKLRRIQLKQERRLRQQTPPVPFFDFFKFLFSSTKMKKQIVIEPIIPQPVPAHKSPPSEDLHSMLLSPPKLSIQHDEFPMQETKGKNSMWEKLILSLQAWGSRKNVIQN